MLAGAVCSTAVTVSSEESGGVFPQADPRGDVELHQGSTGQRQPGLGGDWDW